MKDADILSRQGGDEFIVALFRQDSNLAAIFTEIEAIKNNVSRPVSIKGMEVSVTASIGVVIYPLHEGSVPELLQYAEQAMYDVKKNSGGNGIKYYDQSITDKSVEAHFIENAIPEAIINEEFQLYYQPVIDIQSGRIVGAESLLRWEHPERGMIYPDSFIPIAEHTGYINSIGLWVLDEACKTLVEAQKIDPDFFYITINVAATQIPYAMDPKMTYESILSYGLSPDKMVFEIVESSLLKDQKESLMWMQNIKRFGIKIALDDFGTGYSSLSYLNMYPIDIMKIDKAFVSDIAVNESNGTLVNGIVHMAKQLNMKVICEGVEDEETMAYLQRIGCDIAQGYFISRPIPPRTEFFLDFIKAYIE